jgi:hypothetical protein
MTTRRREANRHGSFYIMALSPASWTANMPWSATNWRLSYQ